MDELINKELFELAKTDTSLKNLVKNLLLNRFLLKKVYHILWHILHSFTINYPENPSEEQKIQLKHFLYDFKSNLTIICSSCNKDIDAFIQNSDIDYVVSSKLNLIQFFCNYHKQINLQYRSNINNYNENIYTVDFIIERYSKVNYIDYIENKYNINLLKLFNNNKIHLFFSEFKNVVQIILSEKYDFSFEFFNI